MEWHCTYRLSTGQFPLPKQVLSVPVKVHSIDDPSAFVSTFQKLEINSHFPRTYNSKCCSYTQGFSETVHIAKLRCGISISNVATRCHQNRYTAPIVKPIEKKLINPRREHKNKMRKCGMSPKFECTHPG